MRAVTIYGADNGIDGIVLDVLLRKHEQIRKALGISVPVPDRSTTWWRRSLRACCCGTRSRNSSTLDFGLERRDDLHKEWESAVEKERGSAPSTRRRASSPGRYPANWPSCAPASAPPPTYGLRRGGAAGPAGGRIAAA